MPQMTFTEILEICQERANREPPDRANRRVRGEDIPFDGLRAVYRIPHSKTEYVLTSAFEREGFSLMPTNATGNPIARYTQYWGIKRKAIDWKYELYWRRKAHGIQLFMAHASAKEIAGVEHYPICWDIEEGLLKEHPEVFERVLCWALEIPNVSVTISKSGGFRICAWVPFVRPKTDQMVARHEWSDTETGKVSGVTYAEILSEKALARIDDRYQLVVGDIAKWPVLTEEEFLKPLAWLTPLDARLAKPNREAVVEEELGADLPEDLSWRDGKYVLISADRYECEIGHKSNPTVEYRKYSDGRIVRICYAGCGEKIIRRGQDNSVAKLIEDAPPVEVRESPSFPHFSDEERRVVEEILNASPDAGWHGEVPCWTTNYEHLYSFTNHFATNGQPDAIMKRRVWWTLFEKCPICEAPIAKWVDRWMLKAGFYCEGCQIDFPLGSYLELELNRKLPNSIVSDFDGYLGDDPEFQDFRLWQPGILTYMGAAMATGKTTEIFEAICQLVRANIGRGIVLVPRVSLAQFLASYYREKHGAGAWGLWHTGSGRDNQFIGTHGVIACLPSLPRVINAAKGQGYTLKDFYIAIDEIDFGYQLLSIETAQSTEIKAILQQSVDINGLVLAGQTEYTAALESFASELGRDRQHEVQGFYNTATPVDSTVLLHRCLKQEGQEALTLAEAAESIKESLASGRNVYAFFQTRRETIVLAEMFDSEYPVVYNGYTKGHPRCKELLQNQRVTDTKLFIGNSAAGVGISLLDSNAHTVVIASKLQDGLNLGMTSQEVLRNRSRPNAGIYLVEPDLPLPVRPSESVDVSLYHEALKQTENIYPKLPEDAIKRNAKSYALSTLADADPATYLRHHMNLAGMAFSDCSLFVEPNSEIVDTLKVIKKSSITEERAAKCQRAENILRTDAVLTENEIRADAMKGRLLPMPTEQLAQEYANAALLAIGWNGEMDRSSRDRFKWLTDEHRRVAIEIVKNNINLVKLEKQRRGWIAGHFSDWMHQHFEQELKKSDPKVRYGETMEVTEINDDRFRGALLILLLDGLKGKPFTEAELANKVRSLLNTRYGSDTYLTCIEHGALGIAAYRVSRFLKIADDNRVVEWTRKFVEEWYPAKIAKRGEYYALQPDDDIHLRCNSFASWLRQQNDTVEFDAIPILKEFAQLPDPLAKPKEVAQLMWQEGYTQTAIKWITGLSRNTIRQAAVDVYRRDLRYVAYAQARRMRLDGHTHDEIEAITKLSRNTISKVTKNVQELDANMHEDSRKLLDPIIFLLNFEPECFTNVQISDTLGVPLQNVNDALNRLVEHLWCIRYERAKDNEFLVTNVLPPRDRFELLSDSEDGTLLARGTVYAENRAFMMCDLKTFTKDVPLLANGTVYGGRHAFMMCDLKTFKAAGEIVNCLYEILHEISGLADDACILYSDFENWRILLNTLEISSLPTPE